MNTTLQRRLTNRQRRIQRRLDPRHRAAAADPCLHTQPLRFELADRTRAIAHGGIGAVHALACPQTYRLIVVRKNLSVAKGERRLFDGVRSFFYLTNVVWLRPEQVVLVANHRCNQENLLAQLHGSVGALRAPLNTLESNGAYRVMTALAWNLKAWWALSLPVAPGRWQQRHEEEKHWVLTLEFRTFVQAFVRLPCQIVRTGRKLVYRLLSWNPQQRIFWRLVSVLRCGGILLEVGMWMSRSAAAPSALEQKARILCSRQLGQDIGGSPNERRRDRTRVAGRSIPARMTQRLRLFKV